MSNTRNFYNDLSLEWNQFQTAWQDARSVWKDDVARQFEKRFMAPWEGSIPAFLSALESLEVELQEVQQAYR